MLEESQRLSEAWRKQLQATLEGFELLEGQRTMLLVMAVRAAACGNGRPDLPRINFPTLPAMLENYERGLVQWALASMHASQKEAAILLGVGPTTLHEKIKRLGLIDRPRAVEEGQSQPVRAAVQTAGHR
jgi:DNA-binding NtrC family response regulator